MRWGSADTFISDDPWGLRMGRPIANEGFIKALLEFGTFDFYDFYCADKNAQRTFLAWLEKFCPDPNQRDRVTLFLHAQLGGNLISAEYDVFHFGDFTSLLPHMVEARNRLAIKPFPITGVTHSLDGLLMSTRYQQLILSDLAPFDAVICTSETAEETVSKGLDWARHSLGLSELASPISLKRIPLAVDDVLFRCPTKEEARARFELPEDVIIALSIGRISLRQKADWSPVLQRLHGMRLAGGLENIVVVIAGGGDETDFALLEQIINKYQLTESIICIPNFTSEIKPYLYAAADFFFSVVDNFQETFGLSILEAMAAGLPVICSELSGYRELVEENKTGFLLPTIWASEVPETFRFTEGLIQPSPMRLYLSQILTIDMDRFETSFRTLSTDEKLRKKMGSKARLFAEEFTWESVISRYENVWTELQHKMANTNWTLKKEPMRLKQNIAHAYSHFTTHQLTAETTLTLSKLGHTVIENPDLLVRYEDIATLLSMPLEQKILMELQKGEKTLKYLRSKSQEVCDISAETVDFHVLWLMKQSAIQLKY